MGHLFIDDCKVKIPSLTCSELCFCPLCVSLPRVVSVDIFSGVCSSRKNPVLPKPRRSFFIFFCGQALAAIGTCVSDTNAHSYLLNDLK